MYKLNEVAEYILKSDYLLDNETLEDMFMRVSKVIASVEEKNEDKEYWTNRFFTTMKEGYWIPATPFLMNADVNNMFSSCFVVGKLEDDLHSIFNVNERSAIITKMGGGIGLNISKLREKDAYISSTKGKSTGAISFMKVFNTTLDVVMQARRRGAGIIVMDVYHSDIESFITVKSDHNEITNFNISVVVDDAFMEAVKSNQNIELKSPLGYVTKTISAKELFNKIVTNARYHAEPGLLYKSTINKDNPCINVLGEIDSCNACGEIPLYDNEACNLSAINLQRYRDENNDFDFEKLDYVTETIVRFLDNSIDINNYPDELIREAVLKTRKLGIGVMGLHSMLTLEGLTYESKEGRKFAKKVLQRITDTAQKYSQKLIKEGRELPEAWHGSKFEEQGIKIRNLSVTSGQPTGATQIIMDKICSVSGIETYFAIVYKRKVREKDYILVNSLFEEIGYEEGWLNDKVIQKILDNNGSCQGIKEVPKKWQKLFKTSLEISWEDHVKMQAELQSVTTNALSKCIAKGTLIQTNLGIMPIEELGNANGIDKFGESLDGLQVIDMNGNYANVISHYSNGIGKTKIIKLHNGNILECSKNHKLMTLEGWKKAEDLTINDYIQCRRTKMNDRPGKLILPEFNPKYYHQCDNKIFPPINMSDEFALYLGMFIADGSIIEKTGAISLTCANDIVEELYVNLVNSIFKITPKIIYDKRTKNTRSIVFNSTLLSKWLKNLIGSYCNNKIIPEQIMKGSYSEQISFLRGITLDGYIKKESRNNYCVLVLYEGYSKQLAKQIQSICYSLGLTPYFGIKYVKNGRLEKYAYNVSIDENLIIPIEEHKQLELQKNKKLILVPNEIKNNNYSYKHKHRGIIYHIKHNNKKLMFDKTLDDFNIDYDRNIYYEKVVNIKNGENELFDIEVEGTHSYVVNGIVSHNTINMSQKSTVEDVYNAYMMAWELGCKGVTVYVQNSRDNQVLSAENKKEEYKLDYIQPISRSTLGKTYGTTIDKKSACGKMYITINRDEKNNIIESFVHVGKSGICKSNIDGINRLVSLCLRSGIKLDEIIDQLKGIICPACTKVKAKGDKIDGTSCADIIGRVLEEEYKVIPKQDKQEEVQENNQNGLLKCPECGEYTLTKYDGCVQCTNCIFQKCY